MLRLAILLAALAAPASAGTLTFEFITSKRVYVFNEEPPFGTVVSKGPGVFEDKYIFDVSLSNNRKFNVSMVLNDYPLLWTATENPYNAILLEAPDGHLGGYESGAFTLSVQNKKVSVNGSFRDYDDYAGHSTNSVYIDHNQGMRDEYLYGYWAATYKPDGPKDGKYFTTVVPVPASLPLVIASFLSLIVLRRRH